jgi:hypothetical protein
MTALTQITAGARITAAILQGIAPLAVIKGADESVTSSATLQDDDALFLSVAANTTWLFRCYLDFEGANGAGFLKWGWSVPSGATLRYAANFVGTGGGLTLTTHAGVDTPAADTTGAGNLQALTMDGTLVVGSNAGTVQLQWAQNASNATATIVHAQSYLALWQIS